MLKSDKTKKILVKFFGKYKNYSYICNLNIKVSKLTIWL